MSLHDFIYLWLGMCLGGGIVAVTWLIADYRWGKQLEKLLGI